MNTEVAIVIPVRYGSSRFPGKPLARIDSKSMIEHVYDGCSASNYNPKIYIATDDQRIFDFCKTFIDKKDMVVMTPLDIATGSERVAWVAKELINQEYVINVQGDEPLLTGKILDSLIDETLLCDDKNPVATLAKKCDTATDSDSFFDTNIVKLVTDNNNKALYFSRASIPGAKGTYTGFYLRHIGLYGFRKDFLFKLSSLSSTILEKIEELEQLRILQHGYGIRVAYTEQDLVGVDTPKDIQIVETILKERKKTK